MTNCTTCQQPENLSALISCQEQGRFPDLHNLPRISWRKALRALFAPAERLHRYRNLRSAMLYDALSKSDDCRRS